MDFNETGRGVAAPGRSAPTGNTTPDTTQGNMAGRGKVAPQRVSPASVGTAGKQFGPDTGRGRVAAMRAPNGDTVKELLSPDGGSQESNQVRFQASGPIKSQTIVLASKRKLGVALPANFN